MFSDINLLIIISTLVILLVVLMMILIYAYFLKQKSGMMLAQKERENKFQQELSSSQIEIKEQTLSNVGLELHDDLGQKLSVVKLLNTQLINRLDGEDKKELEEVNEILLHCIQDIRNLSKNFISEQIEYFGLVDSINREVKRINKLGLINIQFHYNHDDIDINSKHALILFRISQECINNALKHSRAKNLSIDITDDPERVKIVIKDNGIGFGNENINDGNGLKNMKKRAQLIHAEFEIYSQNNSGTEINIDYCKECN